MGSIYELLMAGIGFCICLDKWCALHDDNNL